MKLYIFGYIKDGEFVPESFFGSLPESTETLKYWASQEENYQVWEYPSGKIYSIKADKNLDEKYASLMPGENSWLPVFDLIKTDQEMVSNLYNEIKANSSILKRVSIRWLRPWETFFFNQTKSTKKFLKLDNN